MLQISREESFPMCWHASPPEGAAHTAGDSHRDTPATLCPSTVHCGSATCGARYLTMRASRLHLNLHN